MKRREFIAGTVACAVAGPAVQNPPGITFAYLAKTMSREQIEGLYPHSETITIDQMRGEDLHVDTMKAAQRFPANGNYHEVDAWWAARIAEMGLV